MAQVVLVCAVYLMPKRCPNLWRCVAHFLSCFHVFTYSYADVVLPEGGGTEVVVSPTSGSVSQPTPAPETVVASPQSAPAGESANESPRERGRVLQKRNPLASEYEGYGIPGRGPGADADGEGSDYRGFFSLFGSDPRATSNLSLTGLLNYNDQSGRARPGGIVRGQVVLPVGIPATLFFDFRQTDVFRYIQHYESVWKPLSLVPDGDGFRFNAAADPWMDGDQVVYLPDRPRVSMDRIETTNRQYQLNLILKPGVNTTFHWGLYLQDYYDVFYRNRLEFQTGNENTLFADNLRIENGSLLQAELKDASTRRYFGNTKTDRLRLRNLLSVATNVGDLSVQLSGYHHYWKSDVEWWNWNFTDRAIGLKFNITDPYFPDLQPTNGWNPQDLAKVYLSSLRVHYTETIDEDLAGRLDLERTLDWRRFETFRVLGGVQYRQKERTNEEERDVYFPQSANPLTLDRIAYSDWRSPVVRSRYDLPPGLDPLDGEQLLSAEPGFFRYDPTRSTEESAQQRYRSEEAVTGLYLLNWWKTKNWEMETGLRYEHTQTHTLGTLTGLGAPQELPASNSYDNWLPAVFIFNHSLPGWRIGGGTSQILMRPQYFDIVNYRRVSLPTRSISEGNPSLEPTTIRQYQLAAEYTINRNAIVSVELYQMDLEKFFYDAVKFEEYPIEGSGDTETFVVSRVENGDRGKIRGFKIQCDLSRSWDDILLTWRAGYVYSESEAAVSTRPGETFTVPGRSRHVFQSTVGLKYRAFSTDFSVFWQSESLDDLGESADRDLLRGNVWNTESSISYRFSKNLLVALKVNNLFDIPERSTTGSPDRVSQNQYSGWWADLSVGVTF